MPQQENLSLKALSDHLATLHGPRSHIFAYIYTPLALTGATGSPGAPLAIR